ncbi:carbonic anhydrase [Planctomycetota bacterium]|nr:carbonic anhydrase [Planctomycetota bacterium]
MSTAQDTLETLRQGNAAFIHEVAASGGVISIPTPDHGVVPPQKPVAVVLSCADSRVPPEVIFKQGCGKLFVHRVAGHVLDTHMSESIEFGCAGLGAKLVLVLGHRDCGAIKATLGYPKGNTEDFPYLETVRESIRPAVESCQQDYDSASDKNEVINVAVDQHVLATVKEVREVSSGWGSDVEVFGAVFDISSGEAVFLNE